jgi:DNA-binding transcriptional regulator GbsR (MarR family)
MEFIPDTETIFIERISLSFEHLGMPRLAGKILGLLLISDPPAQSLVEISQQLKFSKSAVSVTMRYLMGLELIEKVPSPLPRQDYYSFKPGGWITYLQSWLDLMKGLHRTTEEGLKLINSKPPELKARLMEAHDLFSILENELPALVEDLRSSQKKSE